VVELEGTDTLAVGLVVQDELYIQELRNLRLNAGPIEWAEATTIWKPIDLPIIYDD
jgi:hypothetical protein